MTGHVLRARGGQVCFSPVRGCGCRPSRETFIRQFTKNGLVPSSTFDVAGEYVTPSLTLRVTMHRPGSGVIIAGHSAIICGGPVSRSSLLSSLLDELAGADNAGRNRSRPRKGDRHKFPGNGSAVLISRIGRASKKRGKIEPVPGP
jgi:hypothetical protein